MKQRPYQVAGTQFLTDTKRAILADEPGVGKTNQLLLAAQGRTLVLSPAMLKNVWADELEKWLPEHAAEDIWWRSYGGLCKRIPPEPGKPASLVVPIPRDEIPKHWDTIICDEAHYLKNRKTNWTKALLKLTSDRLYLATGTPLPNWGHEIYMFLRFLFPGDRRFTNYWNWIDEYFRTWTPPYAKTVKIQGLHRGLKWEGVAGEWGLSDRWLRREIDDVLPDLPPMTTQTITVQMGPKQGAVYQRLKKEWWALLPETGTEVVSWSDGGIYSKMLQCSTGLGTLDLMEKGSAKLDIVRELMTERRHPTILFCVFKNTAESLASLMREMDRTVGVVSSRYTPSKRMEAIEDFKNGKTDVLVGTVGTLSEGHTLTRADTCIFVERSPRPISNAQARRRIRRFGQDRPTLSIDLITADTVDEDLSKLLTDKIEDVDLAITGFQLRAMAP